jgi:hypothetical protein
VEKLMMGSMTGRPNCTEASAMVVSLAMLRCR